MSWYDGFPPVRATIDCDTAEHTLEWRDGELLLEDHDVDAERALGALGGEPPVCVEMIEAWREALNSPLTALSMATWGDQQRRAREPRPSAQSVTSAWQGYTQAAAAMQQALTFSQTQIARMNQMRAQAVVRQWRSSLVWGLPISIRRMLVATAAYLIEDGWSERHAVQLGEYAISDVLDSCAGSGLRESMRSWAPPGGLVRIPLHVEINAVPPDEHATARVEVVGTTALVNLRLPLRWLADVWARDITVLDGCFVLGIDETLNDGMRLRARALRWERRGRAFVPVEAPALIWRTDFGTDYGWSIGWLPQG